MPRSEAYDLYLSVGSGFHDAQKGQTTLPRHPAGARPLVSEKRLGASGAVYQKNQILLPQQFWNEERYRKSMVFATTFSAAGASAGTDAASGQGAGRRRGRYPPWPGRRGRAKKDPLLLCMENGRASMEKTGQSKTHLRARRTVRCGRKEIVRAAGRSHPLAGRGKKGDGPAAVAGRGWGSARGRQAAETMAAAGSRGRPGNEEQAGRRPRVAGHAFPRRHAERKVNEASGCPQPAGTAADGRRDGRQGGQEATRG